MSMDGAGGLPDVSLQQMRVFQLVAQDLSFSAAARALHLSQSVISRTVQQLERKLGTELLVRNSRSAALTPAGLEFLEVITRTLDAHGSGLARFMRFMAGDQGVVRVAALPSVASGLLPGVIRKFGHDHPDVAVRLTDALSSTVYDLVQSGSVDIGISAMSGELPDGLSQVPWVTDTLLGVVAPDDEFSTRKHLSWADLAKRPFVAMTPGSSVRGRTDAGFAAAGVRPQIAQEVSAVAVAGALVASGAGATALPSLALPLSTWAEPVAVPLVEPVVVRYLSIVTRPDEQFAPSGRRFLDFLLAVPPPDMPSVHRSM